MGAGKDLSTDSQRPEDPSPEGAGTVMEGHARWEPGPLGALGERAWLVLGGGGMKGLSHVGAWQALQEAGVRFHGIVGTSIGALIGGCIAGGMGWPELVPRAFALGDPLRDYIERLLPVNQWDELELPLQVNAVNLETGQTEWFGVGANDEVSMVDAIYASAALPVFYPPARMNGGYYVDGGAEHSFPVHRAAELGATGIVGVDVGAGERSHAEKVIAQGMLAIHQRIFAMMSWRKRSDLVTRWHSPPLLFIRPYLEGYQTFDFTAAQYFLEEGYRATRAALLEGV
jgi:NTE family protein